MLSREAQGQTKISSFNKSSFYLAVTLLCLVLDEETIPDIMGHVAYSDLMRRIKQSLNAACKIWTQETNYSKEGQKIINTLGTVLGKAQNSRLIDSVGERIADGGIAIPSSPADGKPPLVFSGYNFYSSLTLILFT
jgi:hypothetical protein